MTLASAPQPARAVERAYALHLLHQMLRIRRLEEKSAELYSASKIRGFMHLYNGEEAVAVGVMQALTPEDAVVATYREHGQALARGVPASTIMAEMYGKQEGCSRGRGGSMHLFDASTRFYGGNAIVGGALPVAVGLALADKMQGRPRITCCFFGEGAVAEGEFHESMNLAALWQLPVLFVCENNLYAMGTALTLSESVTDLTQKAAGYAVAAAMAEFCMPSLGTDMEAGTLVEWLVQPGTHVKRGDIIAVVETEKGIIDIEVFETGIVEQLLIQPGTKVPVGTVLATISTVGAPATAAAGVIAAASTVAAAEGAESQGQPSHAAPCPPEQPPRAQPAVPTTGKRQRISPLARKRAAELALDLSTVHGTGPEGTINRADVERAAAARQAAQPAPPPPAAAAEPSPIPAPQAGMRRAIAAAMARSNREIPHYYLQTRIDMSQALRWLEAENQRRPIKERLLPAVLLVKAVAKALGDVPELNGYWLDDRHQPQEAIHIGFAIALRQGGLIAPAIHHVDLKSLDELMEALRDLIPRVRAGRLRSSEMSEATITVTNLGDLGVETVYGVIYPPQVALVGFGKITEQPWADNGMLGIRPVVTATLAADHRATDGRRGAQFLEALNRYLQEATTL